MHANLFNSLKINFIQDNASKPYCTCTSIMHQVTLISINQYVYAISKLKHLNKGINNT